MGVDNRARLQTNGTTFPGAPVSRRLSAGTLSGGKSRLWPRNVFQRIGTRSSATSPTRPTQLPPSHRPAPPNRTRTAHQSGPAERQVTGQNKPRRTLFSREPMHETLAASRPKTPSAIGPSPAETARRPRDGTGLGTYQEASGSGQRTRRNKKRLGRVRGTDGAVRTWVGSEDLTKQDAPGSGQRTGRSGTHLGRVRGQDGTGSTESGQRDAPGSGQRRGRALGGHHEGCRGGCRAAGRHQVVMLRRSVLLLDSAEAAQVRPSPRVHRPETAHDRSGRVRSATGRFR